jgi:UDPglucose 6-dehydrogenase
MKIAVIGTGYVGLVSGVCFAETGNNVICVDNNEAKVASLKAGKIPIYEPGLDVVFDRNFKEGRLHFTTDLKHAVEESEIIFLALPTPPGEDGSADLSYILGVAKEIGKIIDGENFKIIVDKSTVPVGTGEKVRDAILKSMGERSPSLLERGQGGEVFDVVSNPEFLREGKALEDFMKPDRVVIGATSEKAKKQMGKLYEPFVRQGNPIYYMDLRSAEMTKYAANSYLATRISFMNEIANLCETVGADVDMVRKGIGSDLRIGKRFLFPGVGYGGSCFPKDVQALFKTANEYQYDFKILDSVMNVNQLQRERFMQKVKQYYNDALKGKHFALWGLAFKPDTDDIREAPALFIIAELLKAGATVSVFDPEAMENVKRIYNDKITFSEGMYDALKDADALLIATEWNEFRNPDFDKMKTILKARVIFDGRNLYELENMVEQGFYYNSIGRKTITA